jgi:hypothetical protein
VTKLPRTYKSKDIHTKPEKAGEHNLTEKYLPKKGKKEDDNKLADLLPLYHISNERRKRTTSWTADEVYEEAGKYLEYCVEHGLKPLRTGLQLWFGISKSQYYDWLRDEDKYGEVSYSINCIDTLIENQFMERAESYPTANLFFLKSLHGYKDSQDININTNVKPEDVEELVDKLGLDK